MWDMQIYFYVCVSFISPMRSWKTPGGHFHFFFYSFPPETGASLIASVTGGMTTSEELYLVQLDQAALINPFIPMVMSKYSGH
ncbi:hypothetical protein GDO81_023965 [Engystomops pustulosus]|uniref:Uncharacterized protein n=1 Tax=Engystomops pustulosus TaxID=76066 RepID=A0AAV6YLE8_ENGPU|nr:hypothetical protein GDO81_023965 [Engystomops pustulosus]